MRNVHLDSRWMLRLALYLIGLIAVSQYLATLPVTQSLVLLGLIATWLFLRFRPIVNAEGEYDAGSISLFRRLSV